MAKVLELMARRKGLTTSYDNMSESGRAKRKIWRGKYEFSVKLMMQMGPLTPERNFCQVCSTVYADFMYRLHLQILIQIPHHFERGHVEEQVDD